MNRIEKVIIAVLILALGLVAYFRFFPIHASSSKPHTTVTAKPVAVKSPTKSLPVPQVSDISIPELAALTNQDRVQAGLNPLIETATMDGTAYNKCSDMVVRNYYSHTTPTGAYVQSFFLPYYPNGFTWASENMLLTYNVFDNAQLVNTAFMGKPDHRAAILRPGLQYMGFAVCDAPNLVNYGHQVIVVEHFLQP